VCHYSGRDCSQISNIEVCSNHYYNPCHPVSSGQLFKNIQTPQNYSRLSYPGDEANNPLFQLNISYDAMFQDDHTEFMNDHCFAYHASSPSLTF
jgi:hypothetical protein